MTISEVKRMARVREWKGLIQEQKESGMTIRAWCEQNGFRENTYYYWLKIIRAEAIEQVEKNAALLRAIPHNSAARCTVPFQSSPACKNLDLRPVNLRFLQVKLTENSLAHRPPHLCGIALRKSRV